jgi:hypothetical protein
LLDDLDTHLYLSLASAQLGRNEDAGREVAEVRRLKPDFTAEAWLKMYPGAAPSWEALFLDGARKAGLPIDEPGSTN